MMIDDLLLDLIRDEGAVRGPHNRHIIYDDHLGYRTLGYGRLMEPDMGGGLSESEAQFMLRSDVVRVLAEMDDTWPWAADLSPAQRRGLANLLFNVGLPRLRKFVNMLEALKKSAAGDAGAANRASAECLDSRYAGQVGDRAKRIADLLRQN